MIIDASLPATGLKSISATAQAAEQMGFNTLWTTETQHDPFLPGALISEHTTKLQFGTAVAIAFARSPATLAYTAWDLAQVSEGRFILGLGTQVKGHIVRRFGMPWPDSVVGKLREQIAAIRAFWHAWQSGEKLNFRGEYYKLTLMSPFFNPGSIEYPDIPIYIAGVNTGLARLAGEVSDGFLVHPFHSPRYLEEVLLPAIMDGAHKSGRTREDIKVSATVFVVNSPEEEDFIRAQISFYASTPSYRTVMALHGWEDTADQLASLASRGRWGEMPDLIDDDMLSRFAVISRVDSLASSLMERYHGLADRITLYLPFIPGKNDDFWKSLLEDIEREKDSR